MTTRPYAVPPPFLGAPAAASPPFVSFPSDYAWWSLRGSKMAFSSLRGAVCLDRCAPQTVSRRGRRNVGGRQSLNKLEGASLEMSGREEGGRRKPPSGRHRSAREGGGDGGNGQRDSPSAAVEPSVGSPRSPTHPCPLPHHGRTCRVSSSLRRVGTRHSSPWTLHVGIPPPADTRRTLTQPRPGELPPPAPTEPLLPHHLGGVHQQLLSMAPHPDSVLPPLSRSRSRRGCPLALPPTPVEHVRVPACH